MKRKKPVTPPVTPPPAVVPAPEERRWQGSLPVVLYSLLLFLSMTVQTGGMSMVLCVLALLSALPMGKAPLRHLRERLCLPVLGLLAFALVNGLAAIYSAFGAEAVFEFYKVFAAVSLMVILLTRFEKKHVRGLLWGLSAVLAAIALLSVDMACHVGLFRAFSALVEALGGTFEGIEQLEGVARINGIYNDANITGSLFALGSLISLYLLHTAVRRVERMVSALLLGVNAVGCILAVSRGALLCFALALLVWLVAEGKEGRVTLLLRMAVAGVTTLLCAVLAMGSLGQQNALPLLLSVAAGVPVFLLDAAVVQPLSGVLNRHKKAALTAAAAVVVLAVGYVVAATQIQGAYTFVAGDSGFTRVVTLNPGEYALSGDWDDSVGCRVFVYTGGLGDTADETEILYYGDPDEAAFTVAEAGTEVYITFAGQESDQVRAASISNGVELPLAWPLLPRVLAERLQGGLLNDRSFLLRVQYMKDAMTLFGQSPLRGHGLGSTEGLYTAVQPYYYQSKYAHNHVLQVMSDMGLLGLVPFLALLLGSGWLLLRQLRKEQDELAAVLLACWVMLNAHGLMELNFSIRAYQCVAFLLLLLPVLLYGRPLLEKKGAVKWGGRLVMLWIWGYLAVFGWLLWSHQQVEKEAASFSATSSAAFMEGLEDFIRRDVFDHEYYQLTYVGSVATVEHPLYNKNRKDYVAELRESGTYTACTGLARYYYLPRGEWQELFACSREAIAQEASTKEAWNLQLEVYRNEVLPVIPAGDILLFVDEVLKTKAYLEEYSTGRMEQIQLTEENQAFLDTVASVKAMGMDGDAAYLFLTAVAPADAAMSANVNGGE